MIGIGCEEEVIEFSPHGFCQLSRDFSDHHTELVKLFHPLDELVFFKELHGFPSNEYLKVQDLQGYGFSLCAWLPLPERSHLLH